MSSKEKKALHAKMVKKKVKEIRKKTKARGRGTRDNDGNGGDDDADDWDSEESDSEGSGDDLEGYDETMDLESDPEPDDGAEGNTEKARRKYRKQKSFAAVARGLMVVAHRENTSGAAAESGGCEGARDFEVWDYLVEESQQINLLPNPGSNAYKPDYRLMMKEYGLEAEWKAVPSEQEQDRLRIWNIQLAAQKRRQETESAHRVRDRCGKKKRKIKVN